MSAPAASWTHTQREISTHTRTLSYDRAGYGGSDPDPHDRTLERMANDLTTMLNTHNETDPIILVGHSWGGPIIRVFADQHPHRIAGLVFIDASVAESMEYERVGLERNFRIVSWLSRFGGQRLIKRAVLPHGYAISEADMAILVRDYASPRAMRTGIREARQITPAIATLERVQAAGTPDVPTICVQAGRVDPGKEAERQVLNDTAASLMAATTNGRVMIVEDAGHLIPQERPEPVREAILEVLANARPDR